METRNRKNISVYEDDYNEMIHLASQHPTWKGWNKTKLCSEGFRQFKESIRIDIECKYGKKDKKK
jgi:hypothetical protein